MPWTGSGVFTRNQNFSADASASIKILAARQDDEWNNVKAGLENTLTRDGQNSPSADLPMAGQKHTNVGAATSVTQYLRADQLLRNFPIYCAFSGTAEAMSASAEFALTSLTAGVQVLLSCPSINTTTSVTMGLTGAGTATVVRADGKGPARGQTKGLHRYVHDGTNWILTDPSPVAGRILVTAGSASATTAGAEVTWNTVVSAEGFSLSTNGAVMVPGGIRAVRTYAYSNIQAAATSTTGIYSFEVRQSPDGVTYSSPTWGAGSYSPIMVFWYNNSAAQSLAVRADYVSVQQSSRVGIFFAANVGVAARTSCQGGTFVVEAID